MMRLFAPVPPSRRGSPVQDYARRRDIMVNALEVSPACLDGVGAQSPCVGPPKGQNSPDPGKVDLTVPFFLVMAFSTENSR